MSHIVDPTAGRPLARRPLLALLLPVLMLGGCAGLAYGDPPRVELVGLQSLPGAGLELRFLAQLRVQNPNSRPLAYNGLALELDLRGQRFASGVAPLVGEVPGYGEALLEIPVSVSGFTMARQVLDFLRGATAGGGPENISYALRGKLGGDLGATRFESRGEIDLGRLLR